MSKFNPTEQEDLFLRLLSFYADVGMTLQSRIAAVRSRSLGSTSTFRPPGPLDKDGWHLPLSPVYSPHRIFRSWNLLGIHLEKETPARGKDSPANGYNPGTTQ